MAVQLTPGVYVVEHEADTIVRTEENAQMFDAIAAQVESRQANMAIESMRRQFEEEITIAQQQEPPRLTAPELIRTYEQFTERFGSPDHLVVKNKEFLDAVRNIKGKQDGKQLAEDWREW
jgi:hypothetical protein